MKKFLLLVLAFTLVIALAACGTGDSNDGDTTPNDETTGDNGDVTTPTDEEITGLTMGFVPSRDAEHIATSVKPLEEKLSEVLGVPVHAEVMTSYAGLIEAMRTGQVDIGFLAPFNFVQAETRAGVQVILKSERRGAVTYRAQFSARADLDHINSIEDLLEHEGLRWAFVDSGSTSGYLYPADTFINMGLEFEELDTHFVQLLTGGHDASIIALINGDADFATTFEDARTVVEEDYPDVMDQVKVLGYTADIPNDTISVRQGLSDEWVQKIKDAFLSFNDDEQMIEVMNEVYQWTGIVEAKSEDYDIVRSVYERFSENIN
jgi:phosphonate transport system substrate-binding protein